MKKYYLFIILILAALSAFQIVSYQEFQRVEAASRLIRSSQVGGRVLSSAYTEYIAQDACLQSELPDTEKSDEYHQSITVVFRELLEEFAIRPNGYSEDIQGGFTQHLLVHGRRQNFILGLEIIEESEGTYRLNGIRGLCELLRDVNGFKAHSEGRECTCD